MSSRQDQVRQLAERIARRVAESPQPPSPASAGALDDELAAMRQSLSELQQRLARIESHLAPEDRAAARAEDDPRRRRADQPIARPQPSQENETAPATRSPWLSGMYVSAAHPSQEKFGVEEATVSELVDFFESAKTCELEPGGKPCDHCSMCSSRGF